MKILFISESDYDGGAARAMFRLYEALKAAGADISILVKKKTRQLPDVILYSPGRKERLCKKINSFCMDYSGKSLNPEEARFHLSNKSSKIADAIKKIKPDLLHLHWFTEDFFSLELLKEINIPVVWTLHDMWSFTGGCNYAGGCGKYSVTCGACPQINSKNEKDISYRNYIRKLNTSKSFSSLRFIAPSKWMKKMGEAGSLAKGREISIIPNCIELTKYKPVNKEFARSALNIPLNKNILLFIAAGGIENERKGFFFAKEAFKMLDPDINRLIVIGGHSTAGGYEPGIEYIDKITDDYTIALYYNSADILLAPSREENLANTIMESLSCGTPAAAFNTGGNPDLIDHLQNGYLAVPFSIGDYLAGVKTILNERNIPFAKNARLKAETNYSYSAAAGKHLDLYRKILGAE